MGKGGPKEMAVIGMQFGSLTVVNDAPIHITKGGNRIRMVEVSCDCGTSWVLSLCSLRAGLTKGCRRRECVHRLKAPGVKPRHGMKREKIYAVWMSMNSRCNNPNTVAFKNYGGRGIKVCQRWELFENFFDDMGHVPSGMTIDRVNNDLGYSKDNCRWATRATQARNKRNLIMICINGEKKCIAEWAEVVGIKPQTIEGRLRRGWSQEDAVMTAIP